MKKILAVCCLAILMGCSSNKNQEDNNTPNQQPSLDEIMYHIYTKYDVKSQVKVSERLNILKTPKGWEVAIKYYDDSQRKMVTRDQRLLWSEGAFQDLGFPEKDKEPDERALMSELNQTLGFYNSYAIPMARVKFHNKTFFGYEGWLEDVREKFDQNPPENIYDQYTYATALYDDVFVNLDQEEISEKDVFKGLEIMKSIKDSKEVTTIVGDLNIKYANDVMGVYYCNKFSDLGLDEQFIEKSMVKDLYPQEAIMYSKTLLGSCPEGAILFTSGDNDTYPLIFVQKVLGYRTDVQVINMTLLHTYQYINYIHDQGITMSVGQDLYKDEISGHFVIEAPRMERAGDYLARLDLKSVETNDMNGKVSAKFPYGLKTEKFGLLSFEGNLIFRSDLAGIDIMTSNDRPVCFANGRDIFNISYKKFTRIGPLMWHNGLKDIIIKQYAAQADSILTAPVMKAAIDFVPKNRFINLLTFSYYNLISYYHAEQETQKRDQVLKFYFDSFNPKKVYAAPTNYLLGLMYKGYFGKEYFPEEFESAKNQVVEQMNNLISKPSEQYIWRDLEKIDDLLSEYTYLKQIETAKVPDYEHNVEKVKNKIQDILSQQPYFKLFILQSRNLQRIYKEINT